MTNVASVIIDLPLQQTNKPYSYVIPLDYQDLDIVGRRVMVDFNHRKLLGFVVDVKSQDDIEGLKTFDALLDKTAVLNSELLELSNFVSDHFFSYRINAISTILPNQYKVKYLKNYHLIDEVDEDVYQRIFLGLDYVPMNEKHITPEDHELLNKLIAQDKVEISTEVSRREKVKTARAVILKISQGDALDILAAEKGVNQNQKKIVESLLNTDKPTIVSELASNLEVSNAVITNLVKKGWLELVEVEVNNSPLDNIQVVPNKNLTLNPEQQKAVEQVTNSLNQAETFLLEGVTGSGKTEVYLQIIDQVLQKGQSAIFLVPEITLTSQIVRRVKERFGDLVGILHSELNDTQRLYQWRQIENGTTKVVVGTRSAIFAPVKELGVIIMDEEHESAYKQEDNPRYHARDIAIWRSKYHNAPLVLGSATPSLESRARGAVNNYKMLYLKNRARSDMQLPNVQIVDMKQVVKTNGDTDFSPQLIAALNKNKKEGKQSILLINRRGYSSFMMCRNCGYVPMDPNCSVALTVHMDTHTLKCHYCGHQEAIPTVCANCGSRDIRYYGTGTQKVEQQLNRINPELKTIVMDVDTTSKKGAADNIIQAFGRGEYDVLIGTQMVAKGLDFPNVGLVGVINSDTSLNLPDFRANEKTFDLLTQVAGRSGRSGDTGSVIFQTFNPDHFAIKLAANHDYENFFNQEMKFRHAVDYPPYFYTVRVGISGKDDLVTSKVVNEVASQVSTNLTNDALIVGPSSRAINKIKNRYQYQFLIKFKKEDNLKDVLENVQDQFIQKYGKDVYLAIDRDPLSFI
ncbi:MAG: primosomal protein N' [Lactobacillaceae bacterium]|jgi:primosomal protein N' (replication factor Y)|nr:primosomal protein N' [Lactobacillaceae bacterium]